MFSLLFHYAVDVIFHILSMPFLKKQWVWFSVCCHCSLSKISGCSFPCAVTAYLVSNEWFSICCPCCYTSQWMYFPYFVTALFQRAVDEVFSFLYVATTHFISSGCFSICCQCLVSLSSGSNLPHAFTTPFQKVMDVAFLAVTLHIQ